jgi:hypothetical protein
VIVDVVVVIPVKVAVHLHGNAPVGVIETGPRADGADLEPRWRTAPRTWSNTAPSANAVGFDRR